MAGGSVAGRHIGKWRLASHHVQWRIVSGQLLRGFPQCSSPAAIPPIEPETCSDRRHSAQLQNTTNENPACTAAFRAAQTQKPVYLAAWQSAAPGTRLCLRMTGHTFDNIAARDAKRCTCLRVPICLTTTLGPFAAKNSFKCENSEA